MFCLTIYNCHTRLQIKFSQILYVKESWMPVATLFLRDGVFWFLAVIGKCNLLGSWSIGTDPPTFSG
jgi:hypothetical protein